MLSDRLSTIHGLQDVHGPYKRFPEAILLSQMRPQTVGIHKQAQFAARVLPSRLLPSARQALKLVQPVLLPDIRPALRTDHHHGARGVSGGAPSLNRSE